MKWQSYTDGFGSSVKLLKFNPLIKLLNIVDFLPFPLLKNHKLTVFGIDLLNQVESLTLGIVIQVLGFGSRSLVISR
jgi:hypothetical protein